MRNSSDPRVLFLTVGLGNPKQLEETLYAPVSVSIRSGRWERIVLLPSHETLDHARKLKRRHPEDDIHIRTLPEGGEADADQCYKCFQRAITELGTPEPDGMCVDITRGTKAMSAALLVAAMRYRIPHVRYIEGERNPDNPTVVVPGSERVRDIRVTSGIKHRVLDDAKVLFRRGAFAGAVVLLRELPPHEDVRDIIDLADFCAAWDQLDYRRADEITLASHLPEQWSGYVPGSEVRRWVHELARPFPDPTGRDYASAMAKRLRLLTADLLANGERRLLRRQYEDALLRAYRALEMLGQARLFDHGLDSAALPKDHDAVRELARGLERKQSAPLALNRDGTLSAGREQVARLLKRLGDPLAEELLSTASQGALRVTSRNHSILIHGYEPATGGREQELRELYAQLGEILEKDRQGVLTGDMSPARFLNTILVQDN